MSRSTRVNLIALLLALPTLFLLDVVCDVIWAEEASIDRSNTREYIAPVATPYVFVPDYTPSELPPPYSLVEAKIERLALQIFAMNSSGKKKGELTPEVAVNVALAITKHCQDFRPHTIAALAWVESGFRPTATLKRPGVPWMLGMVQLNERYIPDGIDPLDPTQAIPLGCVKLRYWREKCTHSHDFLAHWFAGFRVGAKALAAAAKVRARAKLLENVRI